MFIFLKDQFFVLLYRVGTKMASNIIEEKVKSKPLVLNKDHHIPMFPLLQHHPPPPSRGNFDARSSSSADGNGSNGVAQKEVETWKQKVKDLELDKVKLQNHVKHAEESIKSYRGPNSYFIPSPLYITCFHTYICTYVHRYYKYTCMYDC